MLYIKRVSGKFELRAAGKFEHDGLLHEFGASFEKHRFIMMIHLMECTIHFLYLVDYYRIRKFTAVEVHRE